MGSRKYIDNWVQVFRCNVATLVVPYSGSTLKLPSTSSVQKAQGFR